MFRATWQFFRTVRFLVSHPLTKNAKWSALRRFFRWQVGSRLVQGDVLIPFVEKSFLRVRPGMTGATGNVYVGLHEFEDMAFLLHLLRQDDLFVDVGANVGAYTVLASGVVGARSISVEPISATFRLLVENINLNLLSDRVRALNIGIGNESGVLRFTANLDTVNHVVLDGNENSNVVEVAVDSMDGLIEGASPILIKIDVEGYEEKVIAGANKVLSSESLLALIIESNGSGGRYGFSEDELDKRIQSFGFKPYCYFPFERRLAVRERDNVRHGNTLYIRKYEEVLSRLQGSPKYWIANVGATL